jgi:glycosyltransferase 2 family protein
MNAPTLPGSGNGSRRILTRVALSLVIAGGFAWALERGGLPLAPGYEALSRLHWWAVPSFFVLMLACLYFRTARWVYMLRPSSPRVSPFRAFAVCSLGYGTIFFAPLRLGEMVRPYLITSKEEDVTFAQALGTVAAERAIDGLIMVMMTAIALGASTPISPLPDHVGGLKVPVSLVPKALLSAAVLFGVAFAVMAVLYVMRERALRLIRGGIGRFSSKLAERAATIVERLLQGFALLQSFRNTALFLRDTVLFWLLQAAANWVMLSGVGLSATFSQACVTLGIISLGSLLPAGPGFFGAYQVATYTSLAMYYSMTEVTSGGAMFVLASYVGHVALNLLCCAVGFFMLARLDPGRRRTTTA